jgi:outer membrane biosynthesis protein TonB
MAQRLLRFGNEPHWLLEEFVKIRIQSLAFLAALAVGLGMVSWGSALHAQSTPPTPTTPQQQQQPSPNPATPQQPQQTPAPTPDNTQQPPTPQAPPQTPDEAQAPNSKTAATQGATDSQVFTGTVVKQADKYVLQDDAGHTYDIDHQDDVKKFEGKRVRVQGTLDPTGKKILVK